jgi:putative transposase
LRSADLLRLCDNPSTQCSPSFRLTTLSSMWRTRAALQVEILALRHQIGVLQRSSRTRLRLTPADRLFWAALSRMWGDWRIALMIVKPATVIAWHRKGFRLFCTWKGRHGQPGRPTLSREVRQLIRRISQENPLWGAPRIHGELLKLGIDVGETSVSKYMLRRRTPPSQTWRTFLENHLTELVSVDFFTVPTIRFQVLYVFLVLAHDRRRIVHVDVTAHPTAAWTAQQLREAFPWTGVPRYLLHDRDSIFGGTFRADVEAMGMKVVASAPRSPWQRAYVERLIGSIRRVRGVNYTPADLIVAAQAGVPRPRPRAQRGEPPPDDQVLSRLLPRQPYTSLAGQGHPRGTDDSAAGTRSGSRHFPSWRVAPPVRTPSRLSGP